MLHTQIYSISRSIYERPYALVFYILFAANAGTLKQGKMGEGGEYPFNYACKQGEGSRQLTRAFWHKTLRTFVILTLHDLGSTPFYTPYRGRTALHTL